MFEPRGQTNKLVGPANDGNITAVDVARKSNNKAVIVLAAVALALSVGPFNDAARRLLLRVGHQYQQVPAYVSLAKLGEREARQPCPSMPLPPDNVEGVE